MTTLTTPNTTEVRQEFILPIAQVLHLQRLAADRHISENDLVARALDMFLGMADLFEEEGERQGRYRLAAKAPAQVLKNEGDSRYDEIKGMPFHQVRDRLAQDYDALASMYDELGDELADELWIPAENTALLQTEGLE